MSSFREDSDRKSCLSEAVTPLSRSLSVYKPRENRSGNENWWNLDSFAACRVASLQQNASRSLFLSLSIWNFEKDSSFGKHCCLEKLKRTHAMNSISAAKTKLPPCPKTSLFIYSSIRKVDHGRNFISLDALLILDRQNDDDDDLEAAFERKTGRQLGICECSSPGRSFIAWCEKVLVFPVSQRKFLLMFPGHFYFSLYFLLADQKIHPHSLGL